MVNFFVFLFLASLFALTIGLKNPTLFLPLEIAGRKGVGIVFGGLAALFFILIGVSTPQPQPQVASATTSITPTQQSPAPAETPTQTQSPAHGGVFVKVVNVVDGDTIKVETGEAVRYIGIDTPETVHPSRPVQCYGKEASEKNTELVEGKVVELEKDVSETDKYGRLLRYIWLGDTLINEVLVRQGYAQSSSYPPDVKYQDRFVIAQSSARSEQKGLWGSACSVPVTPKPTTVKPTTQPTQSSGQQDADSSASSENTQPATGGSYSCNCGKTCPQMSSCAEAQYQLNVCGCSQRDADKDGIACDADCQ